MKINRLSTIITALTVATIFDLFGVVEPTNAASIQLFGLNDKNTLVLFDPNNLSDATNIKVTGVRGTLLGIDFRPSDGLLYGVTDANKIYTIDTTTGAASSERNLTVPFEGGRRSGFDFNPVPDRLRLVGTNDQNFRINVDTGAVIVDGTLAYAAGDPNFKKNPNITAAAYTNNFAGATSTTLYGIDFQRDVLVRQDPPNAGILNTVGSLGFDFNGTGGFDILTTGEGNAIVNTAFAVTASDFYTIDLSTGAAKFLGQVDSDRPIRGLAARTVPEPAVTGFLIGFGALALLSQCYRRLRGTKG